MLSFEEIHQTVLLTNDLWFVVGFWKKNPKSNPPLDLSKRGGKVFRRRYQSARQSSFVRCVYRMPLKQSQSKDMITQRRLDPWEHQNLDLKYMPVRLTKSAWLACLWSRIKWNAWHNCVCSQTSTEWSLYSGLDITFEAQTSRNEWLLCIQTDFVFEAL